MRRKTGREKEREIDRQGERERKRLSSILARKCSPKHKLAGWHSQHHADAIQYLSLVSSFSLLQSTCTQHA